MKVPCCGLPMAAAQMRQLVRPDRWRPRGSGAQGLGHA